MHRKQGMRTPNWATHGDISTSLMVRMKQENAQKRNISQHNADALKELGQKLMEYTNVFGKRSQPHQPSNKWTPTSPQDGRSNTVVGFYCKICEQKCSSNQQWIEHVNGRIHSRRYLKKQALMGFDVFYRKFKDVPYTRPKLDGSRLVIPPNCFAEMAVKSGEREAFVEYVMRSGHVNDCECRVCGNQYRNPERWIEHIFGKDHMLKCADELEATDWRAFVDEFGDLPCSSIFRLRGNTGGNRLNRNRTFDEAGKGEGPTPGVTCNLCGSYGHVFRECAKRTEIFHAGIKCYNCQKEGHYAMDCKVPVERKSGAGARQLKREGVTCFYCNMEGHLASECKSRARGKSGAESKPFKEGITCFNCNMEGHYAQDCNIPNKRRSGAESKPFKEGITCFNCNREGHYAQDCKNMAKGKSEEEYKPYKKQGITCFNCNREGHYAQDCKYTAKGESEEEFKPYKKQDSICFKCKQPGHMARNCPSGLGEKSKKNASPKAEKPKTVLKPETLSAALAAVNIVLSRLKQTREEGSDEGKKSSRKKKKVPTATLR